MKDKKNWLNTKQVILKKVIKPCRLCGFCPYGQLVEEFPVKIETDKISCEVFGHDCPAFYHSEPFTEAIFKPKGNGAKKVTKKEFEEMFNEFDGL